MFYMFRLTSSSLGVPFNVSLARDTSVKQVACVDNAVLPSHFCCTISVYDYKVRIFKQGLHLGPSDIYIYILMKIFWFHFVINIQNFLKAEMQSFFIPLEGSAASLCIFHRAVYSFNLVQAMYAPRLYAILFPQFV